MIEHKSTIVNTIESNLLAHILYHDTLARLHLVVSYTHDKAIHTLVFAGHYCLSKHDRVVGVASAVGDPELLAKNGRRMDVKFLFHGVISCSSLHLRGVITIAKFSEAETAHVFQ